MAAPILIVGASARAAAQSAVRAGFHPFAADLFADEDLRECCETVQIDPYPQQLLAAARSLPPGPWMYTGGLENHPALVDRLAAERTLLGNSGGVLRHVRDPLQLGPALHERGLLFPTTLASSREILRSGASDVRWLTKPRGSSGGHGISFVDLAAVEVEPESPEQSIWQAYIVGEPASAVFVAAAGKAVLLGVTRQLIGTPWTGATEFGYAGSIGPWPVGERVRRALREIGGLLAERFHLVGLFGVDFVLVGDDVWTIEVNPRYTASIEVLERVALLCSVALHVAACQKAQLPVEPAFTMEQYAGKAIVYARTPLVIDDRFAQQVSRLNLAGQWPQLADVPARGSTIAAGWPICTVLADGASSDAVETRLRKLAQIVMGMMMTEDGVQSTGH